MQIHVAAAGGGEKRHASLVRVSELGEGRTCGDPEAADVILMVGVGDDDDIFLTRLRHHEFVQRWPRKVMVWDERDQPLFSFPGIYTSATASWAKRHKGRVASGPYVAAVGLGRRSKVDRDLLFSFRGALTHPVRDRVARLEHPNAIVQTTEGFGSGSREDHLDLLARSRFALCPRGFGPSSIRLFEAVQMGAVPVVISDDWLPPPGEEWARASIRVPEGNIHLIPSLLESTSTEQHLPWVQAAAAALNEHRFWESLAGWLGVVSQARDRRPWWWDRRTVRARIEASIGRRGREAV